MFFKIYLFEYFVFISCIKLCAYRCTDDSVAMPCNNFLLQRVRDLWCEDNFQETMLGELLFCYLVHMAETNRRILTMIYSVFSLYYSAHVKWWWWQYNVYLWLPLSHVGRLLIIFMYLIDRSGACMALMDFISLCFRLVWAKVVRAVCSRCSLKLCSEIFQRYCWGCCFAHRCEVFQRTLSWAEKRDSSQ